MARRVFAARQLRDGGLMVRSRDIAFKQMMWGFAGGQDGLGRELYGKKISEEPNLHPDKWLWEWQLAPEQAKRVLQTLREALAEGELKGREIPAAKIMIKELR